MTKKEYEDMIEDCKLYDEHIVKYACKKLNINQKTLAYYIGVSEGTVNRWASKNDEVPFTSYLFLTLLVEHFKISKQLDKYQNFFKLFNELSMEPKK